MTSTKQHEQKEIEKRQRELDEQTSSLREIGHGQSRQHKYCLKRHADKNPQSQKARDPETQPTLETGNLQITARFWESYANSPQNLRDKFRMIAVHNVVVSENKSRRSLSPQSGQFWRFCKTGDSPCVSVAEALSDGYLSSALESVGALFVPA